MTDELTERRERVARALRESTLAFSTATDDDDELIYAAADAVLAAYESLEPEYEPVNAWLVDGKVRASRMVERPTDERLYRRVVLPQEAEGTCPTCDGNGWVWTISNITGSGGNANRTAPCPNLAFHSSPNPEGANDE